jgi:hypothetical protein
MSFHHFQVIKYGRHREKIDKGEIKNEIKKSKEVGESLARHAHLTGRVSDETGEEGNATFSAVFFEVAELRRNRN